MAERRKITRKLKRWNYKYRLTTNVKSNTFFDTLRGEELGKVKKKLLNKIASLSKSPGGYSPKNWVMVCGPYL